MANAVTLVRLVGALPLAYLIALAGGEVSVGLVAAFAVLAATDALDGHLARVRREVSKLGIVLDPIADKVFGLAVFGALVWAGSLPAWMLVALAVKEVALLVGGLVMLGRGKDVVPARALGKVATVVLFAGMTAILAGLHALGSAVTGAGVVLSLGAGVDYAVQVASARGAGGGGKREPAG